MHVEPHAHEEDPRSPLRALVERWVDAELRGDAEALEQLLAADFVGVGPRGLLHDKREWIERHATHAVEHAEFTWDDLEVHLHESAAVVTGRHHQHELYAGTSTEGTFRGVVLAVRERSDWRIASVQWSPLVEAHDLSRPLRS